MKKLQTIKIKSRILFVQTWMGEKFLKAENIEDALEKRNS